VRFVATPHHPLRLLDAPQHAAMKRITQIICLLLVVFAASSCEKEPERPDYNYSFKINGVEKRFSASNDANIVFIDDVVNGLRLAVWTMVTGSDPEKNSVIISLRTTERLELGLTYQMQEELLVQGRLSPRMTMIYFDENGKAFGATLLRSQNPGARDNCSLTLSDFTTEGTIGTFEGVLFDLSNTTTPLAERTAVLLTEGKFFLPNFVENL
jgi:hypothetical protein